MPPQIERPFQVPSARCKIPPYDYSLYFLGKFRPLFLVSGSRFEFSGFRFQKRQIQSNLDSQYCLCFQILNSEKCRLTYQIPLRAAALNSTLLRLRTNSCAINKRNLAVVIGYKKNQQLPAHFIRHRISYVPGQKYDAGINTSLSFCAVPRC